MFEIIRLVYLFIFLRTLSLFLKYDFPDTLNCIHKVVVAAANGVFPANNQIVVIFHHGKLALKDSGALKKDDIMKFWMKLVCDMVINNILDLLHACLHHSCSMCGNNSLKLCTKHLDNVHWDMLGNNTWEANSATTI